jgi:hypothetical protein
LEAMKLFNTLKPSFGFLPKSFNRIYNLIMVSPFFVLYLYFIWLITVRPKLLLRNCAPLVLIFSIPLLTTLIFYGTVRFRIPYEPVMFLIAIGHLVQFNLRGLVKSPSASLANP